MDENVHCHFTRNTALFRQQDPFGKSQHLNCKTEVHRDFHRQGETVVTHMGNLGTDIEQQRLQTFKGLASPADHY